MENLFLLIFAILALINLASFIMVGIDKRKSIEGTLRTPEVYFMVWSALFASLGVLLGMLLFHHKTKKLYLTFSTSILLLQQIVLLVLFYQNYV